MSDELMEIPKEVHELNAFETEFVPTQALPVKWSVEKFKVAQMLALSGKTKKQVAKDLGLPLSIINKWDSNSEFIEYKQSLVDEWAKGAKNTRLMIYNKILQARLEQAEVEGYADLSRKDTLDILESVRKEEQTAVEGASTQYTNLLETLLKHSIENTPKIIQVQEHKE